MSSKKRKKGRKLKTAAGLLVIAAAAGAGFFLYTGELGSSQASTESAQSYKEEKVSCGSVLSGITESGTVAFGSADQEFSVAEVTKVTASSSSGSSSDSSASSSQGTGSSSQNSGGSAQGTVTGGSSAGGTAGMTQGVAGAASASMGMSVEGQNSTSGSTSSTSSSSLVVEEVYVAVGQVISEGDPILKISDSSIEEYRSLLEAAISTAELTVKQEEINVESKRAEAQYNYDMYIAEGETAEETYNATITSLENAVTDLEEDLEEAAELVEEYQAELDSGYDVEDELEEAQLDYSTIEANLQVAKNNLTTQSIEAKQTYDNAMTNFQYADQLYEIDTNGLEDDLNDSQDTLEEAQQALEDFEEQIGDGIVYSEYSGTVTTVSYSAGDELTNDAVVAQFAVSDDVSMTVAVSQEDISEIAVGDEVKLSLTAYSGETFAGEVTSISSSSSVGSSTVNYDVTVNFTGDTTKVYSGMTGEATFVLKEAEDVLYVSNKAVRQDGTRSYVKVKEADGTIVDTTVETGFSNGTIVEIVSGLTEGQTVLLESQVTG